MPGYKLREKISKALKARAEAIKKALARYNKCAAALNPPRPELTWEEIVKMASLAEFDLLREARTDIRAQAWANRKNREAMNIHFEVKCAEEEIARLNVEIRHTLTSMLDEHCDYYEAISRHITSDPALAYELSTRWIYLDRIHARVAARLRQTAMLPGFSGMLTSGLRSGRSHTQERSSIPLPTWASYVPTHESEPEAGDNDASDIRAVDSLSAACDFYLFVELRGLRLAGS